MLMIIKMMTSAPGMTVAMPSTAITPAAMIVGLVVFGSPGFVRPVTISRPNIRPGLPKRLIPAYRISKPHTAKASASRATAIR